MDRELEQNLADFGEFLLRERLAPEKNAPHLVTWVRRFFMVDRARAGDSLGDRVRSFVERLEGAQRFEGWQIKQAEQALRLYFVNFKQADWTQSRKAASLRDDGGRVRRSEAMGAMRERLRVRHYSYRTEKTYLDWVSRFFEYLSSTGADVSREGVQNYLSYLAMQQQVSAGTQNQAFAALLFLCREILDIDPGDMQQTVRARSGTHLPVVLSVPETVSLLKELNGTLRLMAEVIYGGGLRVSECCRLRVKDLDFENNLVFVRAGKGNKDRSTLMAESVKAGLKAHLERVRELYGQDRNAEVAGVMLPDALARKYPNAGTEWAWFWVFPSRQLSLDPRAGVVRRHHVASESIQRAVREASRKAEIHKPVSVHTLRHSFATHLLLNGVDIRQIQDYLGHVNVETTMIYTHVVKNFRNPARSPLDLLQEGAQ